jgi:hypothetical protein
MSTATHRAIELLVGFAMVGYCAYAVGTGRIQGKFRCYTRSENPLSFWATVLIVFCIGVVFLLGYVSWRQ